MSDHRHRPGDARVELDNGEHVVVRVYISPLWTVLTSVFEILLGWRRGSPEEWSAFIRDRVDGVELAPLRVFDRPDRTVPNFFLPVPSSPAPTIAEELSDLRRTPTKTVRRDLRAEFGRKIPDQFLAYAVDPDQAFGEFCDAVERYWEAVFAPIWPRMRAVLEREVMLCGRTLATEGVAATLAELHPSFKLARGAVVYESGRSEHALVQVGDRRVALIPVVAGTDTYMSSLDRPRDVVFAYSARGSSAVWHGGNAAEPSQGLSRLLGDTRARILTELSEPATTTLLARTMDMAAGTISHHLSALQEQDVVESTRVGNSVYYSMTERGRSLLNVFLMGS